MDPSLSKTCSWVFPYKRRPLDKLGRGYEGKLQIMLIWYINSLGKQGHACSCNNNWQLCIPIFSL